MDDALREEIETAFNNIDWDFISQEKAELFYKEARTMQSNIFDSMSMLHEKAYQFLAITIPILSVITSYIISQFDKITVPALISGIIFILILTASAISFTYTAWPRKYNYAAVEPDACILDEYYKMEMVDIVRANFLKTREDIEQNQSVLDIRALWLRRGITFLVASPVAALATFGLLYSTSFLIAWLNTPIRIIL